MIPNRARSATRMRLPLKVVARTPKLDLPLKAPRKTPPLTNMRYEGRLRYRVMREGEFTGFYISMPYSLIPNMWKKDVPNVSMIEIGSRQFKANHRMKEIDGSNMPKSWFIDLSGDVEDVEDVYYEERAAA
ncbi:hypothetical protein [Paraburkholderia sp. BCC1886]|uniref:hypothetical protein n=1 Tax=Paraburkholderia sp. BCC1886 TaxID=2562670 RepID=UPI0011836048|nr:hypothetical protein [Paraburkholderia sp. BCC1886]